MAIRRLLLAASITICFAFSASAYRYGNPADNATRTLRVGGAGQLTAVDIQCDQGVNSCNNSGTTTKVTRADTYGAYAWKTTGTCDIGIPAPCWQQVVTLNSLPANDPAAAYNYCANGRFCAPYEIRIAPSDTNVAYMHLNGYVYRHANFRNCFVAATIPSNDLRCKWSVTTFTQAAANPNDNTKFFGPFLAIDPQNTNAVVAGTPGGNAFYTTDGGANWSAIALGTACTPGTPPSTAQKGGYTFAFDPSSSVSGGLTQGIYLTCYGTGVYQSTTGPSGTFSLLNSAGMPTVTGQIVVSNAGLVYVVGSGNIYLYSGGSWSVVLDGTAKVLSAVSIAVDRNNPDNLLAAGSAATGGFYYSTNSATSPTWGNRITAYTRSSTAVPWLALSSSELGGTSFANAIFDPAQSNTVLVADGISVWSIVPNLLGNCGNYCYVMTAMAAGIEQLVTNAITSVPGGNPIGSAWDRALWTFTNPNAYPSNYGPNHAQSIQHSWGADYSGTYVFDYSYWAGLNSSGYSANAGGTGVPADWTTFTAQPSVSFPGTIAVLSTTNVAMLTNQSSLVGQIFVSTNRGVSWSQVTSCSGVPTSGASGWGSNVGLNTPNRRILTSDKTANVYYAFNYSVQPGIYKISADGSTCTRMTTTNFDASSADGYGAMLIAAPGVTGHLFFTAGSQDPDNASQAFHHCSESAGTMTCSSSDSYVTGITDVTAFEFGATKPGDTFPALYLYGRVSADPGWWRCTGLGVSRTCTKLSHYAVGGWLDGVRNVGGDMNIYGRAYIGFQGSGWKYGTFN